MSDLATLELLTAEVVLVDGAWVAYAEDGTVLDDPDGVLLAGNLGALLDVAAEYVEDDDLHQGGPDSRGRSTRSARSRYAEDVFPIERVGPKYEVRPANWRAPWQPHEDSPATPVADPATPVSTSTPPASSTPTEHTPPLSAVQDAPVAVRQSVAAVLSAAQHAAQAQREADDLAAAVTLLLLLEEDY